MADGKLRITSERDAEDKTRWLGSDDTWKQPQRNALSVAQVLLCCDLYEGGAAT